MSRLIKKNIKKKANKTITKKKTVVKKAAAKPKKKVVTSKKVAPKKKAAPKKLTPKKTIKKVASKKEAPKINKDIKVNDIAENLVVTETIVTPQPETPIVKTDIEILELEKKRKTYWTEDTEMAVVEFLKNDFNYYNVQLEKYVEDCWKKKKPVEEAKVQHFKSMAEETSQPKYILYKDKIFRDRIQKPLNKLIENIIFNFKLFRPGVDVKTLHNDCLSFVYGKFANFNPGKNTKSFSYFGTVAKHYLQGEKKELDKFIQTNLDYDDHRDEADSVETFELHDKSDLDTSYTLFNHVIDSIEFEMDKGHLSDNDMKVGDAIIQIFKNHEILGAYNKNHVYHLIKESTGLQTKDITYSLSRYRAFYRLLKQDFIKRDDDD